MRKSRTQSHSTRKTNLHIELLAIDDLLSYSEDIQSTESPLHTKFAHQISNIMASQENQEHSAPTTHHQTREGFPHSARSRGTGNSKAGGRDKSRAGGRGNSKGYGSRGDRGKGGGGGRGGRGGFHKQKEVGRAEWAYVNLIVSSSPFGLINEAAFKVTDEHAIPSKLQSDKR